ncbi:hypothetical protein SH139x_001086 [Planctomycetaceae bacterium SH139]
MDRTKANAVVDPPINASLLDKLLANQYGEADARRFVSGDPECFLRCSPCRSESLKHPRQATPTRHRR